MSMTPFQARNARSFPENYRAEIIPKIMDYVARGESCFIVGMSGTGKSNLFRCIWHDETIARYLDTEGETYAFIWADANGLAGDELSSFYLYELMLYNLQKWVEVNGDETLAEFEQLHKEVLLHKDRDIAQRHLETALRRLFNQIEGLHVVFLFDEFEFIAKQIDIRFLRNLRWFRDEFKYHLSYIMAAHRAPHAIREDLFDEGEPWFELLASNILALPPHTPEDTDFVISELANRYEVEPTIQQRETIHNLSGGHSGLISALFKITVVAGQRLGRSEETQAEQIYRVDAVAGECRKIWNSLEREEQDTLMSIAGQDFKPGYSLNLNGLIAKGIIVEEDAEAITLFSPLFHLFLKNTYDDLLSKPEAEPE